jgi:hypothetical protein
MAKKTTYINKGGLHTLADGTKVPGGETFESTDPNLCAKFPLKFEKAGSVKKPVNATTAAPEPESTATPSEENKAISGQTVAENAPQDVTAEFTVDSDGSLTVLRDKKGWAVFEDGDDDALNDKPLKKKEVQPFIDDYLAD